MINKLWYVFLIDKNYVLLSLSLSFSFSLSENFLMTIPPSKGLLIILVKKFFLSYTYRKIQKPVLVERLRGHLIFSTSNQTILTVLVVISAIPTVLSCIIKWSIRGITTYHRILKLHIAIIIQINTGFSLLNKMQNVLSSLQTWIHKLANYSILV